MKNKWILKNGVSTQEYESFPLAYRTMFAIAKKAVQSVGSGKILGQLSIISPIKDVHGDNKKYSYAEATQLATDSDLLTSDGQINSKVFRRNH